MKHTLKTYLFGVLQLFLRRAQVLLLRTFPRRRLLRTHALVGFSALCAFCCCWDLYGCWPFCRFSDFRASLSKLFLVLSVVKLVELPTSDFVSVYILRGILRHTIPPVGSFFIDSNYLTFVSLDTANIAFV